MDRPVLILLLAAGYAVPLLVIEAVLRLGIRFVPARLPKGIRLWRWLVFYCALTTNWWLSRFGYRDTGPLPVPMRWGTLPVVAEVLVVGASLAALYVLLRVLWPWIEQRTSGRLVAAAFLLLLVALLGLPERTLRRPALPERTARPAMESSAVDAIQHSASPFVLVALDGVDPELLRPAAASGRLPTLQQFINEGVFARMENHGVGHSPIVWTTVATGVHADRHRIYDFTTRQSPFMWAPLDSWWEGLPWGFCVKTILNQWERARVISSRPTRNTDRRAVAFWQVLSHYGRRCLIVNYLLTYPADIINGVLIANGALDAAIPGVDPRELAGYIHPLRAHEVVPRRPRERPASVLDVLETGLRQLVDLQTLVSTLARQGPFDVVVVYTPAPDAFNHTMSPEDYEALEDGRYDEGLPRKFIHAYVRIDSFLGGIRRQFPDSTFLVLSDHGARIGYHNKRRVVQHMHNSPGIFIAHGPGVRPSHGGRVSMYDIAPTILRAAGVPIASDLDGNVEGRIFAFSAPAREPVPTYATVVPDRKAEGLDESPAGARDRLRALGYIQ